MEQRLIFTFEKINNVDCIRCIVHTLFFASLCSKSVCRLRNEVLKTMPDRQLIKWCYNILAWILFIIIKILLLRHPYIQPSFNPWHSFLEWTLWCALIKIYFGTIRETIALLRKKRKFFFYREKIRYIILKSWAID